jgi:hypothetical protein
VPEFCSKLHASGKDGKSLYRKDLVASTVKPELIVKFAKMVFWIAAIWGFLIITPLYVMFDLIGTKDPPPITHPGFFYGFVGIALAWQFAFLVIALDPIRFRPIMLPSIVEKFSYGITVVTLVAQGRMHRSDLAFAGTDTLLGLLFVISYFKTPDFKTAGASTKS